MIQFLPISEVNHKNNNGTENSNNDTVNNKANENNSINYQVDKIFKNIINIQNIYIQVIYKITAVYVFLSIVMEELYGGKINKYKNTNYIQIL